METGGLHVRYFCSNLLDVGQKPHKTRLAANPPVPAPRVGHLRRVKICSFARRGGAVIFTNERGVGTADHRVPALLSTWPSWGEVRADVAKGWTATLNRRGTCGLQGSGERMRPALQRCNKNGLGCRASQGRYLAVPVAESLKSALYPPESRDVLQRPLIQTPCKLR